MKSLSLLSIFIFCVNVILGQVNQSWNPYLNQGIISPAPLQPIEFDGQGTVSFNFGNTGNSSMPLQIGDELKIEIRYSNGTPNTSNPLSSLSGSGVNYFNWTYNATSKIFLGVQNQVIPAVFVGVINVDYFVSTNTPLQNANNGFLARLFPPIYTQNINTTDDDAVSSYTFVRARDFGDAPLSYGSAGSEIDFSRDFNGNYESLVMLGDTIDNDFNYLGSVLADGDDLDGLNDEDGVLFPNQIFVGSTIVVPVSLKVLGGFGFLNAWIDWNANGIFDSNEQVVVNTLSFFSQTINISINVPNDAVVGSTFARFRFGEPIGPTGMALYGEVEDYNITIVDNSPSIMLSKIGTYIDVNPIGVYNAGDEIMYSFIVTNNGTVPLNNISILDSLVTILGGPLSLLLPGESDSTSFSASYILNQNDIDNGVFTNIAYVEGYSNGIKVTDEDNDIQVFVQTPLISLTKTALLINGGNSLPFEFNEVGDEVTYSFFVTNTGNVTLSNVTVNDTLTGSLNLLVTPSELLPGASGVATASYYINQADLNRGWVLNQAIAMVTFMSVSISAVDTALVYGHQQPAISIIKTNINSPKLYSHVGDTLYYTLEVLNQGNITLNSVTVTDSVAQLTGGVIPILEPGQRDTVLAFYVVSQTDLNNGEFINIASVSGSYHDRDGNLITVEDDDGEVVPAIIPDLAPTVSAFSNAMRGPTSFYIIVKVTELNNVKTKGLITVTIPKDVRVLFEGPFDDSLSQLGDFQLNNSEWSYSEDDLNHIFTSLTNIGIRGYSTIGVVADFDPEFAKGFYTLTSQIASGSGGEVRASNNVDADKIDFFIE